MRLRNRILLWMRKRRGRPMSPMQIIAVSFAVIIALGTFLGLHVNEAFQRKSVQRGQVLHLACRT